MVMIQKDVKKDWVSWYYCRTQRDILSAENNKNDDEMTMVTATQRSYYSYVAMTIHLLLKD